VVLLDWSCRESFHILDYLAKQTVPRIRFEIIWIEYFSRRAEGIDRKIAAATDAGMPPPLDQWIILDVPGDVYYHKHLMYNVGLLASRGEIVVICDSDAVVGPGFMEQVIRSFDEDRKIVLHFDQVRNNDSKLYPFNYPAIETITGRGAINWANGKTTGMWDTEDILHTRNYGACMAALREDLIAIGGADEHIDYLGHICGPYEMTFRLVNHGKTERWHEEEFLYHVWHPGQAGEKNYIGPHDGHHVSTRALQAKFAGRVLPFAENPAVRSLRLARAPVPLEELLAAAVSTDRLQLWSASGIPKLRHRLVQALRSARAPVVTIHLFNTLSKVFLRQVRRKARQLAESDGSAAPASAPQDSAGMRPAIGGVTALIRKTYGFFRRALEFCIYATERSRECLNTLAAGGVSEVSLYGTGDLAEIIYALTFDASVRVKNIYDDDRGRFHSYNVLPVQNSGRSSEKVIVTSFRGVEEKINRLRSYGVTPDRIVVLQ
jgi:hypothetical protein